MNKEKGIIFGASLGGRRALKSLRKEYDIVGFVDNDRSKHGQDFMGRFVWPPAEIVNRDVDKIFIASVYAPEIMYQLLREYGILKSKIVVVPAEILSGEDEVPLGCLVLVAVMLFMIGWGIKVIFF
ncbi:nucleoside-diphosphate sugar epimerase/dehydratase [Thiorhodovibrio frisius]|uniref:CoA-binding domain-containing protein n=1 Tax=Thiorhodovibrio frisius TaxID=631362 RepID=H8Z0B9_9GAMM|nr:hypothetical protein [Thiorhodovibrio frisius]EIC22327.1 hypothetical protein Thi970DRAFT_02580 [Thiorhodovibrio frisius]WPL24624.1 hypothetical protein Thiofri_04844 [Thiorhodovibrio frisius]